MSRALDYARAWVFPLVLLALLEWYTRSYAQGSDALAPPTAALKAFFKALLAKGDGSVAQATLFTLGSASFGLAIAMVLGIFLGILLGLSRRAGAVAFLSVEVLRPIPSVALIPLAMLIFGFGYRMEATVVAFACFWPMLILTQAAVQHVEPCLLEVATALELKPSARTLKIILPAILPRLFVAFRLAVAIALVVAVTVEIAANPNGLGYAVMIAQQSLSPDLMLAWLFWIGVIGYGINAATLRLQTWASDRMSGVGTH